MRAYWQGTLSCDLLTIPVKLHAVASRQEPRFHYLHAQCRTPLEYVRHCPHCGIAVSGENIVRGYEHEDALVIVSDRELASLSQTKEPVIALRQCVHAHAVDPISFDHAFYVEPGTGAKRSYALLVEVLRQAVMVAQRRSTERNHDRLIVLRPAAGVLVLHTLFAPTERLSPERLALPRRPPHPAGIKAAQEWVARISGVYVPEQWVDRSQEALSALVARKAKASTNRVSALPVRARRKSSSPPPKAAA